MRNAEVRSCQELAIIFGRRLGICVAAASYTKNAVCVYVDIYYLISKHFCVQKSTFLLDVVNIIKFNFEVKITLAALASC